MREVEITSWLHKVEDIEGRRKLEGIGTGHTIIKFEYVVVLFDLAIIYIKYQTTTRRRQRRRRLRHHHITIDVRYLGWVACAGG